MPILTVLQEIDIWCSITKLTPVYMCRLSAGSGRIYDRIKRGTASRNTEEKVRAWLNAHPPEQWRKGKPKPKTPPVTARIVFTVR